MVLYTPLPPESIFPPDPALEAQRPIEATIEGRLMEIRPEGLGTARIVRLISTDPQDYLNPGWQPGSVITLAGSSLAQERPLR